MTRDALPEVSEPSPVAVDPCAAARCEAQAVRSVVLQLGGRDRAVRFCEVHAARRDGAPTARPVDR